MSEFKKGEIVELLSGGPTMTVNDSGDNVYCQWFAGSKLEEGRFPPESLKHVEARDNLPDATRRLMSDPGVLEAMLRASEREFGEKPKDKP